MAQSCWRQISTSKQELQIESWATMSCQKGQVLESPCHHTLKTLAGDFPESLKSWSKAKVMMSHCGFDLHFPDDQWCWAPFYVPGGHLYVFFGEGWLLSKKLKRQQALARMWRKENSCTLLVGTESGVATIENSVRILKKLQIELLLGIYSRGLKSGSRRDIFPCLL